VGVAFVRTRRRDVKGSAKLSPLLDVPSAVQPIAVDSDVELDEGMPVVALSAAPLTAGDADDFELVHSALCGVADVYPDSTFSEVTLDTPAAAASVLSPPSTRVSPQVSDDDVHAIIMEDQHSPLKAIAAVAPSSPNVAEGEAMEPVLGYVGQVTLNDDDDMTVTARSHSYNDAFTADAGELIRDRSRSFSEVLDSPGASASTFIGSSDTLGDIVPVRGEVPPAHVRTARMVRTRSYGDAIDSPTTVANDSSVAISVLNEPNTPPQSSDAFKANHRISFATEDTTGGLRLKSVRRVNPLAEMKLERAHRGVQVLELDEADVGVFESLDFSSGATMQGSPEQAEHAIEAVGGTVSFAMVESTTEDSFDPMTDAERVSGRFHQAQLESLAGHSPDVEVENSEYLVTESDEAGLGTQSVDDDGSLPVDQPHRNAARGSPKHDTGLVPTATSSMAVPTFRARVDTNQSVADLTGGTSPGDCLTLSSAMGCGGTHDEDVSGPGAQQPLKGSHYLAQGDDDENLGVSAEQPATIEAARRDAQEEYLAVDPHSLRNHGSGSNLDGQVWQDDEEYLGVVGDVHGTVSSARRFKQQADSEEYLAVDPRHPSNDGSKSMGQVWHDDEEYLGVEGDVHGAVSSAHRVKQQQACPEEYLAVDDCPQDEYLGVDADSTVQSRPSLRDSDSEYLGVFNGARADLFSAHLQDRGTQEEYLSVDDHPSMGGWRTRAELQFDDDDEDDYLGLDGKGREHDDEQYLGVDGRDATTVSMATLATQEYLGVGADHTGGFNEEYLTMDGQVIDALSSRRVMQDGPEEYLDLASDGKRAYSAKSWTQPVIENDDFSLDKATQRHDERLGEGGLLEPDEEYVIVKGAKSVRNQALARHQASPAEAEAALEFLQSASLDDGNFILAPRGGMEPELAPNDASASIEDGCAVAAISDREPRPSIHLDPTAIGGSRVDMESTTNSETMRQSPIPPIRSSSGLASQQPVKCRTTDAHSHLDWRLSTVARAFDSDSDDDNGYGGGHIGDAIEEEEEDCDRMPQSSGPTTVITASMFAPTAGHRGAAHRPSGRRLGKRLANVFKKGRKRQASAPHPVVEEGAAVSMIECTSHRNKRAEIPAATSSSPLSSVRARDNVDGAVAEVRRRDRNRRPSRDNIFVPMTDRKSVMLVSSNGTPALDGEGTA